MSQWQPETELEMDKTAKVRVTYLFSAKVRVTYFFRLCIKYIWKISDFKFKNWQECARLNWPVPKPSFSETGGAHSHPDPPDPPDPLGGPSFLASRWSHRNFGGGPHCDTVDPCKINNAPSTGSTSMRKIPPWFLTVTTGSPVSGGFNPFDIHHVGIIIQYLWSKYTYHVCMYIYKYYVYIYIYHIWNGQSATIVDWFPIHRFPFMGIQRPP